MLQDGEIDFEEFKEVFKLAPEMLPAGLKELVNVSGMFLRFVPRGVNNVGRAAFIDAPGKVFGTTGNMIGGLFGLHLRPTPTRIAAAVMLQAAARRSFDAKQYAHMRRAAIRVQQASRGYNARNAFVRSRCAATKIATKHRMRSSRKRYALKRMMVIRLQASSRRVLACLAGKSRSSLCNK